jgi:hypothetical protein
MAVGAEYGDQRDGVSIGRPLPRLGRARLSPSDAET